jgi:hypothetical protein
MAFDPMEWRRRLSELLKEHPDIGRATGMFEANLSDGGITKAYLNKKIRTLSELPNLDHLRDKVESISVRIIIG